uniref:Uncharacterized protein n=1 Tax=viral metagenome TaxID=1070528 RepID=A0A6C0J2Z1_9ZZZZ
MIYLYKVVIIYIMTLRYLILLLLSCISESYISNVYNIIPKRSLITILKYKKTLVKNKDLRFINNIIDNSYDNPSINNKLVKNTVVYDNNIKNISSITLKNIYINTTDIKNIRIYSKNDIINIHLDNNKNIKKEDIDIITPEALLNLILVLFKIYTN